MSTTFILAATATVFYKLFIWETGNYVNLPTHYTHVALLVLCSRRGVAVIHCTPRSVVTMFEKGLASCLADST